MPLPVDFGTLESGRGGTFVDHRQGAEQNVVVVTRADRVRFVRMLYESCTGEGVR